MRSNPGSSATTLCTKPLDYLVDNGRSDYSLRTARGLIPLACLPSWGSLPWDLASSGPCVEPARSNLVPALAPWPPRSTHTIAPSAVAATISTTAVTTAIAPSAAAAIISTTAITTAE